MKNTYRSIFYILVISMAAGCAKTEKAGVNEAGKQYFDAWMSINYPGKNATWNGEERTDGNGIYIIGETEGNGKEITEDGYAIVEYTLTDLKGNIASYTDKLTAKQLGTYDTTTYYGPQVWITKDETIQAGLQNALVGMKVGGRKKVIIPSWLMTYSSYGSVEEYLKKSTDYSNSIYDFTVVDFTDSIDVWQKDSIERYIVKEYGDLQTFSNDTTGFYFKRNTTLPTDAEKFPADTTIYINYTGKLLNGLVFDTTDERTAIINGLYNEDKDYEPVKISWGEKYGDITMNSNSTISGFAFALWHMRYSPGNSDWHDGGTAIFYSPLGYGHSGSGASIPGYAPLIFEIEIVEKPE